MNLVIILFVLPWLVFGILYWVTYNSLIYKKNTVKENKSGIEVQLKKRYDLIPNLIKIAKKYMEYEEGLLTEVIKLREESVNCKDLKKEDSLNQKLESKLGQLQVRMEGYPELKADKNIGKVMTALKDVEDNISAARRSFNYAVKEYNSGLEMFPSNIVAKFMKLEEEEIFEIREEEKENIDVDDLI